MESQEHSYWFPWMSTEFCRNIYCCPVTYVGALDVRYGRGSEGFLPGDTTPVPFVLPPSPVFRTSGGRTGWNFLTCFQVSSYAYHIGTASSN